MHVPFSVIASTVLLFLTPSSQAGEPAAPAATSPEAQLLQAELCGNVALLRKEEMTYDANNDGFLAAKASPRLPEKLDATAVPWKPDPAFTTLRWSPITSGNQRGTYWVTVTPDMSSFVAHGAARTAAGAPLCCTVDAKGTFGVSPSSCGL